MAVLDPAVVADLLEVARAFGLGPVQGEPVLAARGRQGLVWRVRATDASFAVKELEVELTEPEVEIDVAFQSMMRDRGVPTPRPLRTPAGAVLVRVGGRQFRSFEWVDLRGPRRDLDPQVLGELLARLHRDPLAAEPRTTDHWYTEPVPEPRWREASARLAAAEAPFAAESTQELAVLLVEFCHQSPERAARLYRAYRRAGGPGRITDPSDFTMVLAQFGHFAITAAQQWLDAAADDARARAEAWFREGWEEPLGHPQIEGLLGAVRGI